MTLQDKIKELKLRSRPINYAEVSVNERGARGNKVTDKLAERVITGYLIVWGNKNMYGQKCIKGSCSKSLSERGPKSQAKYKITFLWQHKQDDPLSLFDILEEDDYGLYFETKPLDDVASADRALKQIASGTLNQFSVGFDYVWDKIEYDEKDDSLVLKEIDLFEGSVVTIGADGETYATSKRSAQTLELLHDDTEEFINTLPRKDRIAARQLFARHKSLVNVEEFKPEFNEPVREQSWTKRLLNQI